MATTIEPVQERSVGELFGELAAETGTLVHQEVELATAELTQKAVDAGKRSLRIAAGAALALVALITLAATCVIALAYAIPLWLSALIIAVIFGGAGYGVAQSGITALKHADLRPTETIASLKEDKTWTTNLLH
jgi:hypothetical protein